MVIRKYELMFILNPEIAEEEQESLLERIKGYLIDAEAEILSFRLWGFRRLAYPIHGHKEGRYYLAQFAIDTQKLAPFEHSLQLLSEGILRELVTCLPDDFVPEVVEEPQKEPAPVKAPSEPTKEEASVKAPSEPAEEEASVETPSEPAEEEASVETLSEPTEEKTPDEVAVEEATAEAATEEETTVGVEVEEEEADTEESVNVEASTDAEEATEETAEEADSTDA